MRTKITYTTMQGENKAFDVDRQVYVGTQAKRAIAAHLNLPAVDAHPGEREDLDGRLKHGGVDPESVRVEPLL